MLLVGLTGGLASGKTTVARMFEACGAKVIEADLLARQVVEPGKPAWRDIRKTFGKNVVARDQTLDRAALANIVFADRTKLKHLTAIIYPRVAREQTRITKQIIRNDPHAVIVYDAAMLIEAGAYQRMDRMVLVKADRATQLARACRRDGLTKTAAQRRMRHQMPLRQKFRYATHIIDGTLPTKTLRSVVKKLYVAFDALSRCRTPSHARLQNRSYHIVHARPFFEGVST